MFLSYLKIPSASLIFEPGGGEDNRYQSKMMEKDSLVLKLLPSPKSLNDTNNVFFIIIVLTM
jgi:hypothetical protein